MDEPSCRVTEGDGLYESLKCTTIVWTVLSWVVWLVCVLMYLRVMLIGELVSILKQGMREYLRDPQNAFDLVNILLLTAALLIAPLSIFLDMEFRNADILRAIAIFFAWFCMLCPRRPGAVKCH
jgi:hypothetical protein